MLNDIRGREWGEGQQMLSSLADLCPPDRCGALMWQTDRGTLIILVFNHTLLFTAWKLLLGIDTENECSNLRVKT